MSQPTTYSPASATVQRSTLKVLPVQYLPPFHFLILVVGSGLFPSWWRCVCVERCSSSPFSVFVFWMKLQSSLCRLKTPCLPRFQLQILWKILYRAAWCLSWRVVAWLVESRSIFIAGAIWRPCPRCTWVPSGTPSQKLCHGHF